MAWTMANQPGRGARVWRYMSLRKLSDLVRTGQLHLSRLDALQDEYEGRWFPGAEELVFTPEVVDPVALVSELESARCRTYASCWTLRLTEQPHMWERFNADVAVTAIYEDLVSALPGVAVGGVAYVSSLGEFVRRFPRVNSYNRAFAKRRAFQDEREIRIVQQHTGDELPPSEVRLPIDLPRLNMSVWTAPALAEEAREILCSAGVQGVGVIRRRWSAGVSSGRDSREMQPRYAASGG